MFEGKLTQEQVARHFVFPNSIIQRLFQRLGVRQTIADSPCSGKYQHGSITTYVIVTDVTFLPATIKIIICRTLCLVTRYL